MHPEFLSLMVVVVLSSRFGYGLIQVLALTTSYIVLLGALAGIGKYY